MVTKAEKERILALMNEMKDAGRKSSVAFWGAIEGKKKYICYSNQACHAGLNGHHNYDRGRLENPDFIISRIQWGNNEHRRLPNKIVDAYLRWLTVDSPYAKAFAYKGGEASRKRGFVITHTNVPSNLMAGALFAARAITEHFGQIALIWYLLKEQGVHPNLAFCYAHHIQSPDHERVELGVGSHNRGWHVAWNGEAPKSSIQNFLEGNMVKPNKNYKEKANYLPVQALWGITEHGNPHTLVKKAMATVENGGVVKKVVNPFKAANLGQKVIPLRPFIEVWAKMIKEIWAERVEEEVLDNAA